MSELGTANKFATTLASVDSDLSDLILLDMTRT